MDNIREYIVKNTVEGTWFTGGSYNNWSKFKNKASVLTESEADNVVRSSKTFGDNCEKFQVNLTVGLAISSDIDESDYVDEMKQWLTVHYWQGLGFYLGIKKASNQFELESTYVRRSKFYPIKGEAERNLINGTYER